MAEVMLTFDNVDGSAPPAFAAYAEIQIARRLYRDGESEYLINKTPVRLRDVQDFFRDTGIGTEGYTIVEQGRIAEIVSAKPEERRALIEEAAGISKYKARRQEAERKIEADRAEPAARERRAHRDPAPDLARSSARPRRPRATSGCASLQRVLELSLAADERAELARGSVEARAAPRARALRDAATGRARPGSPSARRVSRRGGSSSPSASARSVAGQRGALRGCARASRSSRAGSSYERRERESLARRSWRARASASELREQRAAAEREAARLADELAAVEAALEARGARRARAPRPRCAPRGRRCASASASASAASPRSSSVLTRVARAEDRLAACEDRRAEIDAALRNADEELEVRAGEAARARARSSASSRRGCATCSPSATA